MTNWNRDMSLGDPLGACTRYLVLTVEGKTLGPFVSVKQAADVHSDTYPEHKATCGCEMGRFEPMYRQETTDGNRS